MNVSYYPGCSLDGTAREYGESVEAVFKTLGIELQELPDWSCCGSSSAHVSNDELSLSLAARNLHIAEKIGLDLVVPCAACYQRLKVAEKSLLEGKKVEGISTAYEGKSAIKHVADFLWEYAGESTISKKVKKTLNGLKPVCYYGCLTTRPPKITDAARPEDPRSMDYIARSLGAEVHNWSYKTDCCGGNMILTRPDIAHRLVKKLLDMAIEAGANCIAVSCPMCFSNLDSPQKEISRATGTEYHVPVYYITELMGIAFGDASVEKWLHRHITDPVPLLKQLGLL
jgi:heterodisulfide reductase subunit B